MNSSNFLKLLENCLRGKLEKSLKLNSRQFGFRKTMSCNMANSVLRETIRSYTTNGSNVHAAFLDLSKAFDKVNHSILPLKLLEAGVSKLIVNLIIDMCNNQYVNVIFEEIKSASWKIGNGVRQGGIISPLLFNFYINDILNTISEMNIGCNICYYKLNIIGYADDIVLLFPSTRGLQTLLDKLSIMLKSICLVLNTTKSVYMIFRTKRCKKYSLGQSVCIDDVKLTIVDECKYLGAVITIN